MLYPCKQLLVQSDVVAVLGEQRIGLFGYFLQFIVAAHVHVGVQRTCDHSKQIACAVQCMYSIFEVGRFAVVGNGFYLPFFFFYSCLDGRQNVAQLNLVEGYGLERSGKLFQKRVFIYIAHCGSVVVSVCGSEGMPDLICKDSD